MSYNFSPSFPLSASLDITFSLFQSLDAVFLNILAPSGNLDPIFEANPIGAANVFPTIGIFPTVFATILAPVLPIAPLNAIPLKRFIPVVLIPLFIAYSDTKSLLLYAFIFFLVIIFWRSLDP